MIKKHNNAFLASYMLGAITVSILYLNEIMPVSVFCVYVL